MGYTDGRRKRYFLCLFHYKNFTQLTCANGSQRKFFFCLNEEIIENHLLDYVFWLWFEDTSLNAEMLHAAKYSSVCFDCDVDYCAHGRDHDHRHGYDRHGNHLLKMFFLLVHKQVTQSEWLMHLLL